MGLYRRERTGKGSYVTTSLLAEGVWATGMMNAAALCDARFFPLHDRKNPPNATINLYRTADDQWLMLGTTPDKLPALAKGIGRADLLSDPRFSDATKLAANMAQLTAILDEVFSAQPMAHWHDVLERAHITFSVVMEPAEVVKDPQLRANDIVVPIEGAGGKLTFTISSPIQMHGVAKVPAKRAPEIGEHNEEILEQLGFSATEIEGFRASRAIPGVKHPEVVTTGEWTMSEILTNDPEAFADPRRTNMKTTIQPARFNDCLHPNAHQVGDFRTLGFERESRTAARRSKPRSRLIMGDLTEHAPFVRIHSQCFTGEVLGSLRCDCSDQLEIAMRAIAEEGCGLVIYEHQEGRGIGLMAKLQAYALQDAGLDTVDANHALGLQGGLQDFQLAGRDPARAWHQPGSPSFE